MSDFVKVPEMREPLIPLSHLELDLPTPTIGWSAGLAEKGISVLLDDLGRLCLARADAKRLFAEKREHEARAREVMARNEQRAIEADRVRRASIWQGVPADHMPPGVAPAAVMLQSARDSTRPRRTTPLQEALSNSGELTYHPLPSTPEDES